MMAAEYTSRRVEVMPIKQVLLDRLKELEEEYDELQDALDQIADLAAPPGHDSDQDSGDDLGETLTLAPCGARWV
jgi:hypothetical protein